MTFHHSYFAQADGSLADTVDETIEDTDWSAYLSSIVDDDADNADAIDYDRYQTSQKVEAAWVALKDLANTGDLDATMSASADRAAHELGR